MASQSNRSNQPTQQGPTAERAAQLADERGDLRDAGKHQTRPDTASRSADEQETGAAKFSAQAAGTESPERDNDRSLDASQRALFESRGSHESRTAPNQHDPNEPGGGRSGR